MRIATYNVEWFDALFDDAGHLLMDDHWSARRDVTRAQQIEALGLVFAAIDADAVMVIEAPDTSSRRSSIRALQEFAEAFSLRARQAVIGFPNQTQQEIALLYDPDVMTAQHNPQGLPDAPHAPRFDGRFRIDLDIDATEDEVVYSKPPLELAVTLASGRALRMMGVHLKSKGDFIGRAALAAQKQSGVARRLCCFEGDADLPLFGGESLFQKTCKRVSHSGFSAPIVIGSNNHRFLIGEQLSEIGVDANSILLEPVGRNTAPPALMAAMIAHEADPDALVLLLPGRLIGGTAGDLLSALVVAGAFAAFLSTTSGLVVSLAGVISQDILGGSVRGFRLAALISAVVPLGIATMTDSTALAGSVGLVFAFTASTICPVLLLGIWWRGLTDAGAIAGMLTGALLCGGSMMAGTLLGSAATPPWLAQPAAWTVPAAFAVMVLVSRATQGRVPRTITRLMTRLHTPERPLATER